MKILKFICLLTVLTTSFHVTAGEPVNPLVGPDLPDNIRTLLIKEMNAVHEATKDILDALVRGQDEVVAEKAKAIHDSFIMKKQMTQSEKEQLIKSVPEEFLERDKAFHELSAKLANAANNGNKPLQMELFADMVDSCISCHSHHATHRFPEFGSTE